MEFLVKALFRWNKCSKMMIWCFEQLSGNFFSDFFLDIEKFYQILSTSQISDQLDHSNRNYSGSCPPPPPSPAIPICKSPACLGLVMLGWKENSSEIKIIEVLEKYFDFVTLSAKCLRFVYILAV